MSMVKYGLKHVMSMSSTVDSGCLHTDIEDAMQWVTRSPLRIYKQATLEFWGNSEINAFFPRLL